VNAKAAGFAEDFIAVAAGEMVQGGRARFRQLMVAIVSQAAYKK